MLGFLKQILPYGNNTTLSNTKKQNAYHLLMDDDFDTLFTNYKTLPFEAKTAELILRNIRTYSSSLDTLALTILLYEHQYLLPATSADAAYYQEEKLLTSFFDIGIFAKIIKYNLEHLIEPLLTIQRKYKLHHFFEPTKMRHNMFIQQIKDFTPYQHILLSDYLSKFFKSFLNTHNAYLKKNEQNTTSTTSFFDMLSFALLTSDARAFSSMLSNFSEDEYEIIYKHLHEHSELRFINTFSDDGLKFLFSEPILAATTFKNRNEFLLQWCDIETLRRDNPQYLIC